MKRHRSLVKELVQSHEKEALPFDKNWQEVYSITSDGAKDYGPSIPCSAGRPVSVGQPAVQSCSEVGRQDFPHASVPDREARSIGAALIGRPPSVEKLESIREWLASCNDTDPKQQLSLSQTTLKALKTNTYTT